MTKILLVEDDKAIVSNLTEFLNNEGYIVKSVSGQTAAIKLLAEEKVDLVLLDISLAEGKPCLNGKQISTSTLGLWLLLSVIMKPYAQRLKLVMLPRIT